MAPIKVGIIGVGQELSNTYKTGEWGIHHLHALVASPAYDVVAICNSTVESASRSIRAHGLDPQAVKAYGSAEDLAADPAVDLVVVAVHVDKHVQLAKPAIEAGKNVMVEFPLARDLAGCEELAQLAQKKGVRTMCGTQAYSDATYAKLGQLVREGAVGEVVSVAVLGTSPISVAAGWPESAAMFLDIDGGANRIRIQLGHFLGAFSRALGDFATVKSVYKTQTKTTTLLDATMRPSRNDYPVTAPDTMLLQGVLTSGAAATVHLRCSAGTPVDGVGFRWLISGTEGEMELTSPVGFVQTGSGGSTLKVRKWGDEAAQEVSLLQPAAEEPASIEGLDGPAVNISRAYEAFARGEERGYATFETGLAIHRLLAQVTKEAVWAP